MSKSTMAERAAAYLKTADNQLSTTAHLAAFAALEVARVREAVLDADAEGGHVYNTVMEATRPDAPRAKADVNHKPVKRAKAPRLGRLRKIVEEDEFSTFTTWKRDPVPKSPGLSALARNIKKGRGAK